MNSTARFSTLLIVALRVCINIIIGLEETSTGWAVLFVLSDADATLYVFLCPCTYLYSLSALWTDSSAMKLQLSREITAFILPPSKRAQLVKLLVYLAMQSPWLTYKTRTTLVSSSIRDCLTVMIIYYVLVNVVGLDPGLQCSVSILRRLKNFVKIKFQGSECPTFSNILVDRLACQSDPATFRIYRDIQNAQDDLSITSSGDSTVYTFSGLSSIADPCREKFIDDVQFCLGPNFPEVTTTTLQSASAKVLSCHYDYLIQNFLLLCTSY